MEINAEFVEGRRTGRTLLRRAPVRRGSVASRSLWGLLPLVILCVGPGGVLAQAVDEEKSPDDASVRGFWSALDEVWAERDADRFAALFTTEASFQFVNRGQALEGGQAIHGYFIDQFSRQSPQLRHLTTVHEIRVIREAVRAIDGQVQVVRLDPAARDEPTVLATLAIFGIMNRRPDGWQIHILRAYDLPQEQGAESGSE